MLYDTCTQGNGGDSQLLVVGGQIANLIPGPSFSHNLCFKCSNGSCELILDIFVPRDFQWYRELFNPMGFDPWNYSLKIQKSIGTPTPKVGVHLDVWGFIPSHSPTLPGTWDVAPRLPSWLTPLQALALIASLRLGLQHIYTNLFQCSIWSDNTLNFMIALHVTLYISRSTPKMVLLTCWLQVNMVNPTS
jgi:hypothetical protein